MRTAPALHRGAGAASFDLDLSPQRGSKPSPAPKQSDFAVGSPGDHLAAQMSSVAQANAAKKARAQAMQAAAEGRGVRQGDGVQAQDEGPQLG